MITQAAVQDVLNVAASTGQRVYVQVGSNPSTVHGADELAVWIEDATATRGWTVRVLRDDGGVSRLNPSYISAMWCGEGVCQK